MITVVTWSAPARRHFLSILKYIENKFGAKTAAEFIVKADHIVSLISQLPDAFPVVDEKRRIRKCLATKKTVLFYQIKGEALFIVNIYDARMDPSKFEF